MRKGKAHGALARSNDERTSVDEDKAEAKRAADRARSRAATAAGKRRGERERMTPEQQTKLRERQQRHLQWREVGRAFARLVDRGVDVPAATAKLDETDPEWDRKLCPSFRG